jgi:hypothetical protein
MTGTNLAEKYLVVSVIEYQEICRASAGGEVMTFQPVTINGTSFLQETGGDVAAGNIYEWTAYSAVKGPGCISLMFVLHSHNADSYQPAMRHFNTTHETAVFSAIMSTYLGQ